ncbi:Kelch repeat-containing protein [Brevibacillus laterosporus]|uniref:Kelch repeat-containing protein n=1 Tax=Brevibacillus laterosporus TaxID=1465 RepID=UPI000EAF2B32|nr:kelch repeat-containing protein [Brevibacillus laterosporus]AYK08636.1 galactose oxidase [Brevibacillus laterosporus]
MNLKKIGLFALAMIMTLFSFQTYSFAAEEMEWVKKAPMPTARYNVGGIVYDDKIYVYGGTSGHGSFSTLVMYDSANDEWETLPSSSHARGGMGFVENKGKFYAIGGDSSSGPTNIVEVFDPVSNNWTSAQSMPTSLRTINAVSLDNTIYTFGGIERNVEYTNLVYSFNPETNSWVSKKPMPFKGYSVSFIKNNSIYVIHNDFDAHKITIYLYDHIQDTWTQVDEFSLDIGAIESALNFDERIIFTTADTLSYYNLNTKKLETINVAQLNRGGCAYGIVNGKLYVIGGTYHSGNHTTGPTSDVVELNLSDLINPDPTPDPDPNPNPDPKPDPNPNPNPTGNALLVIYMDSGLIKEYEMTNEEIRNFTGWYEDRAKGNGREAYIVNKKYNIGPFNSRKDFISYSHIESFEVQEYSR